MLVKTWGTLDDLVMSLKWRPLKKDFVLFLFEFICGREKTRIRAFWFGSRRGNVDDWDLSLGLRQHQVGEVIVGCCACLFVLIIWKSVKGLIVLEQTMRLQWFYIDSWWSSRRRCGSGIIWYQLVARSTIWQWISVARKCRRVQKVCEQFYIFSADNWESSTLVDCSGIGESRGCWSPSSIRRRRSCWSAACGWEIWSWLDDWERWRREDILQDLRPRGEGDLEDDREDWRLGALVHNGEDDGRPQDDRCDYCWDAGDRRRGDKDGCPASFLVLPASRG